MEMRQPNAPELRLLLACARGHHTADDEAAIRQILAEGVDWTRFSQKAMDHGLAGLAGHTLDRTVPDAVPADILAAFRTFIEQTRINNQKLLNELAQLTRLLAAAGVEIIPFKGPVLAQQAFGDLGLRGFRDLDMLIHDRDVPRAIGVLCDFGYERHGKLTSNQFDLIHRLQGQEIMFKKDLGAIEPHTRLISMKMTLEIDYAGFWQRARRQDIFGHPMLTLAPEDTLISLAIHGGKELWWDIKWACDVSDFIAAHPTLDWAAIVKRAREYGCYRMVLVATALARNYLGGGAPAVLTAAEARDPAVGQIVGRILARWEAPDPGGPPSNKTISRDRLLLHDGVVRQASYILRTWFLPGPQHIPLLALPRFLNFAYIPFGLGHDLVALPAYRAFSALQAQANYVLATSPLALALTPLPSKTRQKIKGQQIAYRRARRALAADAGKWRNWSDMGDILTSIERHRDAVEAYDRALALLPDQRSVWQKRNRPLAALRKAGKWSGASEAPVFDIKDANGWALYAGYHSAFKRHAEAARASDLALQIDPEHDAAIRIGINARLFTNDWSRRPADNHIVEDGLVGGKTLLSPFDLKMISDSEQDGSRCASLWTRGLSEPGQPLWAGERYRHGKIRIAYLSTDFRSHPVGTTIVAPLEHHDKSRFEITAASMALAPGCDMQKRIRQAVDHFVEIHKMDDNAVAAMLREQEIDIAIDLNGLTGSRRSRILMRRPAPLQASYLGYPGTTAMPFIDYVIADKDLIPEENRAFFTEQVAYLPDSYLPYDRQRKLSEAPPSRGAEGLPETGFVFACFNRLNKISPDIFDIWMRLLRGVEGSILWTGSDDPTAMANLRREAAARGVAPERIVFARYKKRIGDHLARQRLADLFLDTLPYNAHSTSADALWAGLPVLTCRGQSFQSRVAAGILRAIGLPELITNSLAEYEQRALSLARDPVQLAAIRKKLADNRDTTALFDAAGFTRGLEAVYTTMWERQQSGLPPQSFSVAAQR